MGTPLLLFLIVSACIVLGQVIAGALNGVRFQFASLVTLLASYASAYLSYSLGVGETLLSATGYLPLVLNALVGVLVSVIVYTVGITLAKRARKRRRAAGEELPPLSRVGGAGVGSVIGLLVVTIFTIAIRLVGSTSGSIPAHDDDSLRTVMIESFASIKTDMEASPLKGMIETLDPIPENAYSIIEDAATISQSKAKLDRVWDYPGVQEIASNASFRDLMDDPDIVSRLSNGEVLSLLNEPKVLALTQDPELMNMLKSLSATDLVQHANQD